MEPGHEDREYAPEPEKEPTAPMASMEPGHEDREYRVRVHPCDPHRPASMEPGHEDREYRPGTRSASTRQKGLNGARS